MQNKSVNPTNTSDIRTNGGMKVFNTLPYSHN